MVHSPRASTPQRRTGKRGGRSGGSTSESPPCIDLSVTVRPVEVVAVGRAEPSSQGQPPRAGNADARRRLSHERRLRRLRLPDRRLRARLPSTAPDARAHPMESRLGCSTRTL